MLYVIIYLCPTYNCFIHEKYLCTPIEIMYLNPNVTYMVKSIYTILLYKF